MEQTDQFTSELGNDHSEFDQKSGQIGDQPQSDLKDKDELSEKQNLEETEDPSSPEEQVPGEEQKIANEIPKDSERVNFADHEQKYQEPLVPAQKQQIAKEEPI